MKGDKKSKKQLKDRVAEKGVFDMGWLENDQ